MEHTNEDANHYPSLTQQIKTPKRIYGINKNNKLQFQFEPKSIEMHSSESMPDATYSFGTFESRSLKQSKSSVSNKHVQKRDVPVTKQNKGKHHYF